MSLFGLGNRYICGSLFVLTRYEIIAHFQVSSYLFPQTRETCYKKPQRVKCNSQRRRLNIHRSWEETPVPDRIISIKIQGKNN